MILNMQPLRCTITIWVRLLLRRKAPKANIEEIDSITDLLESDTMLEQTIERWFEEATTKGLQKGMQQGIQEGMNQGFAKAVALQLQMRFGPVPPWAQDRLSMANEEQLTQWLGVILTAKSMDELFATDGPVH